MLRRFVVVISVILLSLTTVLLGSRLLSASDGTVVQLSNAPWQSERVTITVVLEEVSELRAHDVVTAIDGQRLSAASSLGDIPQGEYLTYTVVRDGTPRQVSVPIGRFPLRGFLAETWPSFLLVGSLLTVAILVFRRRPDDPPAQALMLIAALATCGTTAWLLGDQAFSLATQGPSPLAYAGELALALVWGALVHFALVAPGTRLGATWKISVGAYFLPLVLHAGYLAVTLPAAQSPFEVAGRVVQISLLPSSILPFLVAALMFLSYRSMDDAASRHRMRWVFLSFAAGALAYLFVWTLPNAMGRPVPPEHLLPLLFVPPTFALAAAIMRYRLFDIEVILRRSLIYGGLTVSVLLIYVLSAWLFSSLLGPRPGLVALLGSGLVALSVPPLLASLRRRVSRLIYGSRDDPYEVISRLEWVTASDPRSILQVVANTLAETLRLPFVSIELRSSRGRAAVQASCGRITGTPTIMPLTVGSDVVGRLVLAVGAGREPFGPADRRLLDTLIRQVSAAASTVLLTAELRESREQIVTAREEERRRLHHRLHDGLGPSLAASVMQMDAIRTLLRRDPDRADSLLIGQISVTRELIADVRRVVYNLRPPALDQLGLTGALRERACALAQPTPELPGSLAIAVEQSGDTNHLPAAVEVAAFWIGVEAVSNVVRHARASHCVIRVTRTDELSLEVLDDGRGLPEEIAAGGGFISMRERAEELGGTCTIGSNTGGGTTVHAHIPIREERDRV